MKKSTLILKAVPAALLALGTQQAMASGFQLLEQNASGLGNAYAGSAAVAENASTIYYNPAGMTYLGNQEYSVGLNLIQPSYKFSNDNSSSGTLSGNGGDAGRLGPVPNAYGSWMVSKDLYIGLGIGAPFGLSTKYDNNWIGAAQSQEFDIKTININPSVAYRVNDAVSLGFGLDWQQLDATYKRLVGVGVPVFFTAPASIQATMHLSDDAWGWNAGGIFKLSPETRLGLSYRSQIKYHTTGDISLASGPAGAGLLNFVLLPAGAASNVKASLTLPDTAIGSLVHKLNDRWDLLADLSWTGWSSIPKIDIMRTSGAANGTVAQTLMTDFRDTWRVALGATNKVSDQWKMKYGIAFDQTPVKGASTRRVSLPDNDRVWFSIGAQYAVSPSSTLDLGAAYLYIKNPQISNNQTTNIPFSTGLVDGSYDGSIWILGAQYSVRF